MKAKHFLSLAIAISLFVTLVFYGCTKNDETENEPPTISITSPANGDSFLENSLITFSATAGDIDGRVVQVRFYINGEYIKSFNNPPYTYEWNTAGITVGAYKLKATVDDDNGASTSASVTIQVDGPPVANFSADKTNIFIGDSIQFTDLSSNSATSWLWEFGDGDTSHQQNPVHTYVGIGDFTVTLTVHNSIGSGTETKTGYISVTTFTLTDPRDSQQYDLVEIDTFIVMAENLNYDAGGGNCWYYNNNSAFADPYGRLYDWQTAKDACPSGWHLMTDEEWNAIIDYLGGISIAGGKLKETGTSHWDAPNLEGTNESGFSAVPGGYRENNGNFINMGVVGYYWSTEEGAMGSAYCRKLFNNSGEIQRIPVLQTDGNSVRCIKD